MGDAAPRGLGWLAIARLGLVQASIGAIVMLATSLLNRVMVVEYALAAAIPAGLVAWHYAVQLARPLWGHGSDRGRRRTPWIVGGMAVLAGGALLAVRATILLPDSPLPGAALAILAFTMIGAGVGAAGTSMLALLASGMTNAEIADQLFLSSRTVESHRGALQRKLGVRSRAELARVARDVGLTA